MSIVTRFAPSPTGDLHIGSVRTALFSWLYARRHSGKFLLRIEDTDRLRSTQKAIDSILESLEWLGLDYDDPPIYQSKRSEVYRQRAEDLLDAGLAYHCVCSRERLHALREEQMAKKLKARYDNKCRDLGLKPNKQIPTVIRFKNPLDGEVEIHDMVQGRVAYQNAELDDLIIIRTDDSPTYNFAVVVDEIDMKITHVIRGDDHLNNTPRQINLYQAFEKMIPRFGHVPMILSPEGRKLSKRDNVPGILEFRDNGYLPETILNYLVRLGWSSGDKELFTIGEMIELFDAEKIHRSPAALNYKKLEWVSHQHIMELAPEKIESLAEPYFLDKDIDIRAGGPKIEEVFEVQKSRSKTLVEFVERSMYFYQNAVDYNESAAKSHLTVDSLDLLRKLREQLERLSDWNKDAIQSEFKGIVELLGIKFGAIAQPVRVALTGDTISPGIDVTVALIGRKRVLERLDKAIDWIEQRSV